MTGLRVAWAFLTRLPGGRHPSDARELAAAVAWFPIVGAVVGTLVGVAYAGLLALTSAPLAATFAVAVGAMVTGAFHEDGLADTADSFGGYTIERRLEIMRDSRVGTFGALALVVVVLARVAALSSFSGGDGIGALVVAHAGGRAAAVVAMRAGPDARADGLAAASGDVPGPAVAVAVLTMGVGAALGPATAVVAGALALLAGLGVAFGRRHLGGVTGDLLGAIEQVAEVVTLVVLAELGGVQGWLW